jgi:hypothetical protein
MIVKELRAILSVLNDDTEVNIEWQEGTRFKPGRIAELNSVEIEEGFTFVTLKAVFHKNDTENGGV